MSLLLYLSILYTGKGKYGKKHIVFLFLFASPPPHISSLTLTSFPCVNKYRGTCIHTVCSGGGGGIGTLYIKTQAAKYI